MGCKCRPLPGATRVDTVVWSDCRRPEAAFLLRFPREKQPLYSFNTNLQGFFYDFQVYLIKQRFLDDSQVSLIKHSVSIRPSYEEPSHDCISRHQPGSHRRQGVVQLERVGTLHPHQPHDS